MPFSRPTLPQLIDRAAADIETRLPGTDARLRRSNLGVLSRVHAGAVHGLYGYLDWLARQIMPDSAEMEHMERWAAIWGVSRKPGSPSRGPVTFAGSNGSVVPLGTLLQRSDGAEYATDEDVSVAGGSATVTVTAVEPGLGGNTEAYSSLTLVSPVSGVQGTATVSAAGLTGGADTEDDASLRERLLDRIQEPPHGGARFDYRKWALEVPGVTRAWAYPLELGLGTVSVRFVTDDDPGGLIPDGPKVEEVQAYIDERRPVTADVTVVAPVAVALDFTIEALQPDTAAVREAIEAELADLLRRSAEPGGTILLSHIREAISIAEGEHDHVLLSPSADVTHAAGEIAVMGSVTWA